MQQLPLARVALILRNDRLAAFFPLLQQEVRVVCRVGVTLENLLVKQWGIEADYVTRRITTIFLNSRAIDDVAATEVHGGAVIALSGAMPGLVGATMRRGGFYAAMRGAMTYRDETSGGEHGIDRVRVKLFNLLLKELGPGFIARGIIMTGAELSAFIAANEILPEHFTKSPRLDGRPLAAAELSAALAALGDEELLLTVDFEDTP